MFDKVLKVPLTMVKPRRSLPFFQKNYLPYNITITVFVPLKRFLTHEEVCQVLCVSFDPWSITGDEAHKMHTIKKFTFISLVYSQNTNYANSFYGNEMYVNLCRGVFRTQ